MADAGLFDTFVPNACCVCKKTAALHRCSRCQMVWYCSRACQKSDWACSWGQDNIGHRALCKPLGELRRRITVARAGDQALGLFHPADARAAAQFKVASASVLEVVLGRPYYDDEAVHVLYQRNCARCHAVFPQSEWINCSGAAAICWCSDACRAAGEAAPHFASERCQHNLLRSCAEAVARSLRRGMPRRPPVWPAQVGRCQPNCSPNVPANWAQVSGTLLGWHIVRIARFLLRTRPAVRIACPQAGGTAAYTR
jgi:hypothetical protein